MTDKPNRTEIDKLWSVYTKTRDTAVRERLILHYAYLVKIVAGRVRIHVGSYVELEDMVSYGIFGLIDAVEKFDYVKGVKFETYASLRIRGSIIDFLRKLDWVPRSVRQKSRLISTVYNELEAELGREPTDDEVALKLGIPEDEVKELSKKGSITALISLDDYLSQNYEGSIGTEFNHHDPGDPEREMQKKETRKMLEEAIQRLSEKEQRVLTLYYFEELTLKEISLIMEVSESRISQIHSKAMARLRARFERQKDLFLS